MRGNLDDKFLVASSIAGDEEAFGKIYDKYVDEIYRFIIFRVKSTEEAQDLLSETFLKAWQYISTSGKMVDNIRALLYRIGRNLIIDQYRKSGRYFQQIDQNQYYNIPDPSLGIEEITYIKDDIETVFACLENLSEEAREIVTMKYVQDLSVSEIAKILGKNKGAIRVALHRAKNQIKDILKNKNNK